MNENSFRQNLINVQSRIAAACARAGRSVDEVTLVAVSKTQPFDRLQDAYSCGQVDFGENYMQDCLAKMEAAQALALPFKWHFIGHLQRNKAKFFNSHFTLLHTLDSFALAHQLSRFALKAGFTARVLVQVNLARETSKSGVDPAELIAFLDKLRYIDGLSVLGLMTIPPAFPAPEAGRPFFRELFKLMDQARAAVFCDEPHFKHLSMGMSNDFEIAVEEGATLIRVGSLLFGERFKR